MSSKIFKEVQLTQSVSQNRRFRSDFFNHEVAKETERRLLKIKCPLLGGKNQEKKDTNTERDSFMLVDTGKTKKSLLGDSGDQEVAKDNGVEKQHSKFTQFNQKMNPKEIREYP